MDRQARVSLIRSVLIATGCLAASALIVQPAKAKTPRIVLNCEIGVREIGRGGSTQILIDEDAGVVIYDFDRVGHLKGAKIQSDDPALDAAHLDPSMNITINNDKIISASDTTGSAIVITKHDGRFVYSYAWYIPTKQGNFFAYGDSHWGTCIKNPFQ